MKFDITDPKLEQLIENGYIRYQTHPEYDLRIYNYTELCQYEKMWNEYTLMCRGLIVSESQGVIARAFDKFFNLGEGVLPEQDPETLQELIDKHGNYTIEEKLDGSLGIVFYYKDEWHVATRGSFTSEQAIKAKEMLPRDFNANKFTTHLFEIIYPSNRIVVDYGRTEKLIYLKSRDPYRDSYIEDAYCRSNFDVPIISKKIKDHEDNAEGYVLVFEDGFRVKIKFEEYKRLHRLITGMNPRHIWESLMNNDNLDELIKDVPDEFYNWVTKVREDLMKQYKEIEVESLADFMKIKRSVGDTFERKEFAVRATKKKYPSVLFALLDQKRYDHIIWKMIKPSADSVFKIEI